MDKIIRMKKLMWRWSMVSFLTIALFWLVVWLATGQKPVADKICLIRPSSQNPEGWYWAMPIAIPRIFDAFLGPIFFVPFIYLLFKCKEKRENRDKLISGLIFGLIFGLVAGLVAGLVYGLVAGLVAGLVYGLVYGLVAGLVAGLVYGLVYGLGFGLVFGLVSGLVFGLASGLVFGLVFGLGICLIWMLTHLKSTFSIIYRYMMAEED